MLYIFSPHRCLLRKISFQTFPYNNFSRILSLHKKLRLSRILAVVNEDVKDIEELHANKRLEWKISFYTLKRLKKLIKMFIITFWCILMCWCCKKCNFLIKKKVYEKKFVRRNKNGVLQSEKGVKKATKSQINDYKLNNHSIKPERIILAYTHPNFWPDKFFFSVSPVYWAVCIAKKKREEKIIVKSMCSGKMEKAKQEVSP